ncbi:hypothetical protein KRR38_34380 [Novosphingobium sp. G106]|uniref:hypothetical protein n=1 Tax=Novosphingobium sp. G106 TaxID=2849500 RepID=UPI001C2DDB48|nr:hypothetical protein [Novosphingobium sp. G106]MBV1692585.1 hypothetical protein [Novosphingobium sp. G106]
MTDIELALARLGRGPIPPALVALDDAVLTGVARRQQEAALAPRLMGVAGALARSLEIVFSQLHTRRFSGLFFRFQDSHHMRLLLLGSFASAVLISAPAYARPIRVDIPVQIQPNSWVYIQWVTVKADGGRTIVAGSVSNKKWFANRRGDLHVTFVKDGQQVACQESNWRRYRFHSRGQWHFSASIDVPVANIDSVSIAHVIHDQGSNHTSNGSTSCSA